MDHGAGEISELRCDVLDDDAAVREVICGVLSRNGVPYRSFSSLQEQLAGMEAQHPDLLFLDVKLSDADAIEVVRKLHDMGYAGHIQVVSGLDSQKLSDIYAMIERYGYSSLYPISKPFRSAAIKSALQHVLTTRLLPAKPKTVLPPQLLAGWIAAPGPGTRALVVQPHLVADPDQPDLLESAEPLSAVIDEVVAAAAVQRQIPEMDLWIHLSLDAVLALPLASMSMANGALGSAALSMVVPLEHATGEPTKFRDMRTKLSVYGIGCGLFAARLDGILISVLGASPAQRLVLGEGCVAQIMGDATSMMLAEKIVSSCQALAIAMVAICPRDGPEQACLSGLGIERFAASIQHMRPPGQLHLDAYPAAHQSTTTQTLGPMHDFAGLQLLSDREIEIVTLTVDGLSAKEAARRLGLSHRTVEVHRSNIFAKLGVKNVAQLTRLVIGPGYPAAS